MPYDGSKPSENAIKQALMLTENFSHDAEIILLNVVQKLVLPPMFESPRFRSKITGEEVTAEGLAKELCHQMKEEAIKMLNNKKQEIQQAHSGKNIRIKTKVLIGYPTDEIIGYAKEENIDMIIIGNTGLSGVSRLKALGSVSRGVSEKASCPVMIMH